MGSMHLGALCRQPSVLNRVLWSRKRGAPAGAGLPATLPRVHDSLYDRVHVIGPALMLDFYCVEQEITYSTVVSIYLFVVDLRLTVLICY